MVPDRWRCRKPPPSLFTHAVYPQMPMERAISAQGLLRASSSSKVNSTGAFSASTSGSFPHHGNAIRQPEALNGANDPS
jgi:hypothetical protein